MVKVVVVQRDEMKRSRSRLCEEAVLEGSSESGEPHVKHRKKKEKEMKKAVARDSSESTPPNGTTVLPTAGRHYTVSLALPGSIMTNAQSPELKTYLAGQIARAAVVFNIDEIVVFDEDGTTGKSSLGRHRNDPNILLCRILQFLETPQYLRKALFPMHSDLKFVGLLNPLDCPHHMRIDDAASFREGVVLDRPVKKTSKKKGNGSYVNCGTRKEVQVDRCLQSGVRVTVRMTKEGGKHFRGEAVSPATPRTEAGLYWGYSVRFADSFSSVFTRAPFEGGYDLTVGTSDKGDNVDTLEAVPQFRHLLVVFGGLKGLEYSLDCDEQLTVADVSLLFDHYLNTCPHQGSRTIRTEEAVLITLTALRRFITAAGASTPG